MNNTEKSTFLSSALNQFKKRHNRVPQKVVVTPMALLVLAIKRNAATHWDGVPLVCRQIDEKEATDNVAEARSLGVVMMPQGTQAHLACCDLKT